MAKGVRGTPKGEIRNPLGKNQYAAAQGLGENDARIHISLSSEQKRLFKEAAQKEGMSLSKWMVKVALKAAKS